MSVATIVVQNLLYVIGAVAGIAVGTLAVTLRHRRPTTVEANMRSFNRGLEALAPRQRHRPPATVPPPALRMRAGDAPGPAVGRGPAIKDAAIPGKAGGTPVVDEGRVIDGGTRPETEAEAV